MRQKRVKRTTAEKSPRGCDLYVRGLEGVAHWRQRFLIIHGCFIPIEPVTKRLRPVIRNFFIATDLITTLATNMGLKMLPFYHEDCFELFF